MGDLTYEDQKDVARANLEFYRTFERFDLGAMMELWLEDAGVRCVHPGGEWIVGLEAIRASWRAIFESTPAIVFDVSDVTIELRHDVAWVACVERIHQVGEDTVFESAATTTNLFVRTRGGWKLVCHHASPITRRFFEA